MLIKECAYCGVEFEAQRDSKLYCSDSHKTLASRSVKTKRSYQMSLDGIQSDFHKREKEYLNAIDSLTYENEQLKKRIADLQDEEKKKMKAEKAEREREQREAKYKKDNSINWGAILLLLIPALIALITSWTQKKKESASAKPDPPKASEHPQRPPHGPFFNY
ncbi:MAG: hypothetical protein IPH84_10615 [Bacteroidales bacterium]|nr:hypothetical protein [Bacteroidales bacterium]